MKHFSAIITLSDKRILEDIGKYLQQTRIRQNLTQGELARQAAVSRSTLSLIERGENISLLNLIKILRTLDQLHLLNVFALPEEISPLQLAKGEKPTRKRASKAKDSPINEIDLGW